MVASIGDRILDATARFIAIEDLEKAREEALEQIEEVYAKRNEDFGAKLPINHGIEVGRIVLFSNNCHKEFPNKIHNYKWLGPYKIIYIFPNGSLQLEDLKGIWLNTRVNGSQVKK